MDVYRIVEHKDGSSRIFFSGINKEIKSLIKQQYGAKKFTRAIFKRFVMDALTDRLKGENKNDAQKGETQKDR